LERLEAELTPDDEQVMTLVVTRIGGEGEPTTTETREIRFPKPPGRRRWPTRLR
jgi:hypothetical protein